ncbi:hypothetical protein [Ignavibacterium album]|uniref:hypothetical protein n=1 Tax=Ignavibacterium album TaxID=591197 RepID=UPI0035B7DD62
MIMGCNYIEMKFWDLILSSCSNRDYNITTPNINSIDLGSSTNTILLSTFKFNDKSYLGDWQPKDSASDVKFLFSNYVLSMDGNWSYQLEAIAYSVADFDTAVELQTSDSLKKYNLKFWAKGNLFFDLHFSDRSAGVFKSIDFGSWTFCSDTLYCKFFTFFISFSFIIRCIL